MKRSRNHLSTLLTIVTLAGFAVFRVPEAQAGVRVIRTPSHHGYYGGGHCGPVYRPPVHHCSYTLQQRRIFIGYDHCGRPLYQIHYVEPAPYLRIRAIAPFFGRASSVATLLIVSGFVRLMASWGF